MAIDNPTERRFAMIARSRVALMPDPDNSMTEEDRWISKVRRYPITTVTDIAKNVFADTLGIALINPG